MRQWPIRASTGFLFVENRCNLHGQEVQLIQHVNQISVLLITVERTDKERPRVGYKLAHEQNEEERSGQERD